MGEISVGVLGASGYTGAELVRLLSRHPQARLRFLTADRRAGHAMGDVFPHLGTLNLPDLVKLDDAPLGDVDVIFCALPHGTTQEVIAGLPQTVKVVDLSADFRLFDPAAYRQWYGAEHKARDLQKSVAYGLTELHRAAVAKARLVANPGCYPTPAQLALTPLLAEKRILGEDIIISAASGVSGAGRAAKEGTLFTEVSEGMHAYSVGSHRHAPEIEQGLGWAAGTPVRVGFTPHLVPMNRGIIESIYVKLAAGVAAEDLHSSLVRRYGEERFIHVLPFGTTPRTHHVRGSNVVRFGVVKDRLPGRAIIIGVEDNLVKGASGQAIQNMNVMFGVHEAAGLEQEALFP